MNLSFFFFSKLFHTFDHKCQPKKNAILDEVTYCCPIYKYYEYFRIKNLLRNKLYFDIICKYCIKKCKVHFEHTNEETKYVAKRKVELFNFCNSKWLPDMKKVVILPQTYFVNNSNFCK